MSAAQKHKYITTSQAEASSGVPARTIRWWFRTKKVRGRMIDERRMLVHIDDVNARAASAIHSTA